MAIYNNPFAFEFLSKRLKKSKTIAIIALQIDPTIFELLDEEI